MSVSDALLIFLDARGEFEGWLHLADGGVAARGPGLEELPDLADPATGTGRRIVAVVPGDAAAVHWLEIPAGLAPAQAAAAARLIAAEVSAQPIADMHVAVGPELPDTPMRAVVLVPALAMAGWLGRLQQAALDPDMVVPEPLLLLTPTDGFVRYDRAGTPLYRGHADAFSVEPELAAHVIAGAPVTMLDQEQFEAGLTRAINHLPVDLRQGGFAKRRRWKIEWPLVRRLAALAGGLLLVTLALQVATIFRYTFEADRIEAETRQMAGGDPAALERRLSALRGGGAGFDALAAGLFAAVQSTPNVELTGMLFDGSGAIRATVQGDSPATLALLQQSLEARGSAVTMGPVRAGGGRPVAEFTVRAR